MLILTRYPGQVITLGNDVLVTVLAVLGSKVKIGIDAPKGMPVHRLEVYQRIQKQLAAQSVGKNFVFASGDPDPLPGCSDGRRFIVKP